MTLEEAIKHCEQKACNHSACAKEHEQLAEWLKELQALRKIITVLKKELNLPRGKFTRE